jgi:hypothetical protein
MSIVPPLLFSIAALAAVLTIWKSAAAALPAFRCLRLQLADASQERVIHVGSLDRRSTSDATAEARPSSARVRRHPRPKPVTHRLHHFPHRTHAA